MLHYYGNFTHQLVLVGFHQNCTFTYVSRISDLESWQHYTCHTFLPN